MDRDVAGEIGDRRGGQPLWEFDTAQEFETVNGMVFVGSGYVSFQNGVPGNVLLAFAPSFF